MLFTRSELRRRVPHTRGLRVGTLTFPLYSSTYGPVPRLVTAPGRRAQKGFRVLG